MSAVNRPVSAAPEAAPVTQRRCPNSAFTCHMISVPLDHFTPFGADTLVIFATLPAKNKAKRKGMLVTIVGGPGASGLAAADRYAEAYGSELREYFDLVFFDQRGIGMSGNFRCDDAVAAYYQTEARADTPQHEQRSIDSARNFVQNCLTQLGDPNELRYYSTRQAVEDLEIFRKQFGEDKLWLYGESYGTQFAQWYAAAHPNRVAGMVLDGVVDLTMRGPRFAQDQTAGFNDTLARVLVACNDDSACRANTGGDALRAYDMLARRLKENPARFDFRLADGRSEARTLTLGDLETAASTYLYSADDRMLFLRALSFAQQGRLQPLAELFYIALGLDPQTRAAIPDPTYSDAAYYTVNCADYRYFNGTPAERARRYMQAGDQSDTATPRMNSVFYGDLPCIFWPTAENVSVFDAARGADIPTLVLNATADPATPPQQGRNVFRRLKNAALIEQQNGPHVIFGRGESCIDIPVANFLIENALPAQREISCPGEMVDAYVPVIGERLAEYKDVLDALRAVDIEMRQSAGYIAWSRAVPLRSGCLRGGGISYEYVETGRNGHDKLTLNSCALLSDLVLTGSGRITPGRDAISFNVTISGAVTGTLEYSHIRSRIRVTGTLNGEAIDLSRSAAAE
jgi:pimeloyl-ACP methyl ester carboxylesterase